MTNSEKLRRIGIYLGCALFSLNLILAGCGKEADETPAESTKEVSVAESNLKETSETETVEEKRKRFEELFAENNRLWNEYCAVLQEVAYYDTVNQAEIGENFQFVSARDKLELTRDEKPLWLRPVKDFSVEQEETVEIPYVGDGALDEWIADLTEQNQTISEEKELLEKSRDALKSSYGVEMSLEGIDIAEDEPVVVDNDEAGSKSGNETNTGASGSGNSDKDNGQKSDDKSSSEKADSSSKKSGGYDTSMTIEEMLRKGGWNITSGSGDAVEATKKYGEDTITITTYGAEGGFNLSSYNDYGEYSGAWSGAGLDKQREIVAAILNNGIKYFYSHDFGLDWRSYY
nr:hypothetical protein [uncultured Butyrivibrio sp.]